MKNFLKSTAIFACAALLLGACTDEDTDDVGGGVLSIPTIEDLQAGNEKAVLKWSVPTSNTEVTQCKISWEGNGVSGSTNTATTPGEIMTYIIEGSGSHALTSGNYTVTIQGLIPTTGETSATTSASVTVYDTTDYAGKAPLIASSVAVDGGVEITWGQVNSECDSVYLSYISDYVQAYVGDNTISTGSRTLLPDADLGTTVSYVALLKPADGYDYVEIAGTEYTLDSAPASPIAEAIQVGKEKFIVTWEMPAAGAAFDEIESVVITYGDLTEEITSFTAGAGNTATISGVAAGTYEVTIHSVKAGGFASDAEAQDAYFGEITVYDDATYDDYVPTLKSVENVDGTVTFTLNTPDADCTSAKLTYYTDGGATSDLSFNLKASPRAVTAQDAAEGTEITITATFLPEGAIATDEIEESAVDALTVPAAVPAALTDVEYVVGYSDGGAYITVNWDYASLNDIDKVYVYYGAEEPAEVEITAAESTITLTATDNAIEAGTTYDIYLVAVNEVTTTVTDEDSGESTEVTEDIVSSASETVSAKAYDSTSYTEEDLPTAAVSFISYEGVSSVKMVWSYSNTDLDHVVVTYNGEAKEETSELTTIFPFESGVETFTYAAYYLPYKGVEYVEVAVTEGQDLGLAAVIPATPSSVTAVPSISDAGAAQITVTWTISDAVNVNNTYIYYTETDYFDASSVDEVDGVYTAILTGAEITAGTTYTIYVQAASQFGATTNSTEVTDVYAYDNGTYAAVTAPDMSVSDGDLILTWGETVYADLQSITIAYVAEGVAAEATASIADGVISATTLEGADAGTEVTYTATFCPTNGGTDVEKAGTALTVPYVATTVAAEATYDNTTGVSSINVAWDLAYTEGVDNVYVYYNSEKSDAIKAATTGDYVITSATVGEIYTIYVVTEIGGVEYTDAQEVAVETAYGKDTYSAAAAAVTATTSLNIADYSEVTVIWGGYADAEGLVSITINYGASEKEPILVADLGETATFTKEDGYETFTYTMNFAPSADYDAVTFTSDAIDIPGEPAPDSPLSISLTTGYDASGSNIDVAWTVPSTIEVVFANSVVEWYTVVDGAETLVNSADVASGTYTYEITGLDADAEYKVVVYTESASGTASITSVTGSIDTYNDSSYTTADLPKATAIIDSENSSTVNVTWTSVSSDLVDVTVTYAGTANQTVTVTENTVTSMAYVSGTEEFTYVATFKPSNGNDAVSVTSETVEFVGDYVVTDDGTYEIYTAAGLAAFANVVEDLDNSGASKSLSLDAKLMADIDLSTLYGDGKSNWSPLGSEWNSGYDGTFDGNDKKISNLYLVTDDGNEFKAMFGVLTGTVKNVTFENPVISSTGKNAAIVAGNCNGGTISGCYITGDNASITSSNLYVGSFAGTIQSTGTVSDCHNEANVSSSNTYIGGIVGYINSSDVSITDCTNSGDVYTSTSTSPCYVGGVVGLNNAGTVQDCVNKGYVSAAAGKPYMGGIAGDNSGVVIGCYNDVDAKVLSGSYTVGGVVGFCNAGAKIIACYNAGTVGGLDGTGGGTCGGVVGSSTAGTESAPSYIVGCYNIGSIVSYDSGKAACIGGIAGTFGEYTHFKGCYNTGSIYTMASGRYGYLAGYASDSTTAGTPYYSYNYYTNPTEDTTAGNTDVTNSTGYYHNVSATELMCQMDSDDDINDATIIDNMNSAIETIEADVPAAASYRYVLGTTTPMIQKN